MQDRFKFRAWDEMKQLYKDDIQDCFKFFKDKCFACFQNYLDNQDIFKIEQCTGLRDKNGKLIYEGDIVETHDYTTEHSQIVFDKGCYVLKSKDVAIYDHLSSYEKQCEIIGNIHENPELLEED